MRLSVIIPYTYGDSLREEGLKHLINSIEAQIFKDFELIIPEQVKSNDTSKFIHKCDKLILLKCNEKFNKSWCINVAMKQANTNNILILDADILFGKDYFSKVMEFKQHHSFFSAYKVIILLPGKSNPITRIRFQHDIHAMGGGWFTDRNFFFNELGGMNENYFGYGGEDNDIYYRARYVLKMPIPELDYSITHQYHDWHRPDGANPLNPNRLIILKKAEKNPREITNKLKEANLGNPNRPTLIQL